MEVCGALSVEDSYTVSILIKLCFWDCGRQVASHQHLCESNSLHVCISELDDIVFSRDSRTRRCRSCGHVMAELQQGVRVKQ